MAKLQKNPISIIGKANDVQKEINKANDMFAPKPYWEKYKKVKQLSSGLLYLLPFISIITGSLWLSLVLANLIPHTILALIVGGLLVAILEAGKGYLLKTGMIDTYSQGGKLTLLVGLLLCGVSAYISLQGISTLNKKLDTSLQTILAKNKAQRDSLNTYHQGEIRKAEKGLNDFKNSISWKGKINMYNASNAKILTDLSTNLKMAKNQYKEAKERLLTDQGKEQKAQIQESGIQVNIILVMVAIIELLIITCSWFGVHYHYKVKEQAGFINQSPQAQLNFDDFQALAKQFFLANLNVTPSQSMVVTQEGSKKVGFQMSEKAPKHNIDYLNKYSDVVNLLTSGFSLVQTAKKTGVSRSTVQNVKRVMQAQNAV